MITDVIVYASLALTTGYIVAWVVSPALRASIEQPKYLFLEALRRYDRKPYD
ncbi:MAG: hypothetical protein IT185_10255 [Acidobacteria bacterium]|jgi:hypothetical protein|nr:hypothetical protein [Acidobacteriota bacterium]